jgi:1,4-alpha-glucan branching enzyme
MTKGYLSLVLNLHFPYVKHIENQISNQDILLFQLITNTYIPLLDTIETISKKDLNINLTLSISPSLISMLNDPIIQDKYYIYLEKMIELCEKEVLRTADTPELNKLVLIYKEFFNKIFNLFSHRYNQDLMSAFKELQDEGRIEILASCATSGYLPLMSYNIGSIKSQIDLGVDFYRNYFGKAPKGFWLPKCGYTGEIQKYLEACGISHCILDSHGITYSEPTPIYGTFAPIVSQNGIAFFGRDAEISKLIWGIDNSYPYDPDYLDFKNDVALELTPNYLENFIIDDRYGTGIKYYKKSQDNNQKLLYNIEAANSKIKTQAMHFISSIENHINFISDYMDKPPVIVCPIDSELLGYWWSEGISWLEIVLNSIADTNEHSYNFENITLEKFIDQYPVMQLCEPCPSSWGYKGYNESWLDSSNDWIYKHLNHSASLMKSLVSKYPDALGTLKLALNQALRELLLMQASDWAFILKNCAENTQKTDYAKYRLSLHLECFNKLYNDITQNKIDSDWLDEIFKRDSIFPYIDYNIYKI